ncbi:MAG TPA: helix-turn-helix transcriptional regulator [Pyrinomonadaceae bacterium]|nr:helix-turn-helix transcriptional regulator [Pyrinomonadaceae bacterium]
MSTLVSSGQGGLSLHSAHDDKFDIVASTVDPEYLKAYVDHFQYISPFRRSILDLKVGEKFSRRALVSDSDFLKSPYYNDFYKKQGVFEVEHHALFSADGITGGISLSRSKRRPEFTRDERKVIAFGVKHLGRGLRNYVDLMRFRGRNDLLTSVFDSDEKAIFLVDSKMRSSFYNRNAELLLKSGHDVKLLKDKRLQFSSNQIEDTILDFSTTFERLARKNTPYSGPMRFDRKFGTKRMRIELSHVGNIGPEWLNSGRQIMISISAVAQTVPKIDRLINQYGLTKAESRIFGLLVEGNQPAEISDSLQISINTVKSHIKNIFRKTRCHRQTDLIRLLIS